MRIEVSQLPPVEFNPNWRGNWADRYKAGQVYRDAVFYSCMDARNKGNCKPFDKARLDLTFVFAVRRRRDFDNLLARFKPNGKSTLLKVLKNFLSNAIVDAGLIVDDDAEHLQIGKVDILVDPERAPLTIIDIDKPPPKADETDDCPPHLWKITTDKDGNEVHQCCKCPARKVVRKQPLWKVSKKSGYRKVKENDEQHRE